MLDAAEAGEVPFVFVAVAVNVYAVLSARPVTGHDPDAPVTVHVIGGVVAGVGVTV